MRRSAKMKTFFNYRLTVIAILAAAAAIYMTMNNEKISAAEPAAANPLLAKWTGPYGGIPPFDKVQIADFKPALETAMAENLTEIDKIAKNPAAPTFENTIVTLERSGTTLNRVSTIFNIWSGNLNTPEFQPVDAEMQPKLAAHFDKIVQNEALFKRIEAVYNSPNKSKLNSEQQRLVWVYYTNYSHAGAKLDNIKKARLSAINQQLAGLFTKFSQNLLAEEGDKYLTITNEADLAGLPDSLKDGAADAAKAKKVTGWVIRNTRSSIDPFLTYSDKRSLREKAWRMFIMRGDNGDAHDNKAAISSHCVPSGQSYLGFRHTHIGRSSRRWQKPPKTRLNLWNRSGPRPSPASTKRSPICRPSPTNEAIRSGSSLGIIVTIWKR